VKCGRGSIRKWRNAGEVDTENGDEALVEGSVADGRDVENE
jgi:hypothetical protein